jgi:hypothetical protein
VDETDKLAILVKKLGMETKKRKKNRSYNNLNDLSQTSFVEKPLTQAGLSTNDVSRS